MRRHRLGGPREDWRVKRALLLHRLEACATNLFQGCAVLATAFSEKAKDLNLLKMHDSSFCSE